MTEAPSSSSSLPVEGDMVEGHYKILRGKRVEYEVLDTETGKVSSKMVSLSNNDRYTHSNLPQYQHYQVDGINVEYTRDGLNSASVKLVLLQEPQGEKVEGHPVKTFKVEEFGKILEIRDALQGGDHDVYCTLINVFGVEVLGDIRSLPKDPPILRLPEEMMDMICSYLDERDLYSLRLVSPIFSQEYLPVHKLFRISKLDLDLFDGDNKVSIARKKRNEKGRLRYLNHEDDFPLDLTNEAYQEFLRTTTELRLNRDEGHEDDKLFLAVKINCTNLERIRITFTEAVDHDLISDLVVGNQRTLQQVWLYFNNVNETKYVFDLTLISGCKKLRDVYLPYARIEKLESLASLKGNLKELNFDNLTEPLKKEQLMWISGNLRNLERLGVDVLHNCFDTKVGEIDDKAILSILDRNKSINFHLEIYLHDCTDWPKGKGRKSKSGRLRKYCAKGSRIRKQVMRALKEKGKSSEWTSNLSKFVREGCEYPQFENRLYSNLEFTRKNHSDDDNYSKDSSEDEDEDQ